MKNVFTCVQLGKKSILTGDSLGNFIEWNLCSKEDVYKPTVIATFNEAIRDISEKGPSKIVQTKSGKFYYWTFTPRMTMFGEPCPEIADGELLNQLTLETCNSNEEMIVAETKIDLTYRDPIVYVYHSYGWERIDIKTGEVIEEILAYDLFDTFNCYRDFIVEAGEYFITAESVYKKPTMEIVSTLNSYGDEFINKYDIGDILKKYIYKINGYDHKYAVVDEIFYYQSEKEENFVRVLEVDPEEIEQHRSYMVGTCDFGYSEEKYIEFKIKRSQSSTMYFYKNLMATITSAGKIKIFDYEKQTLLYKLKPPKTNEFGDVI